mmetsp:Transcript_32021/g.72136  ORF Transcript_32021/g.72136 Transcript_32021/m.72136 type:complete len:151 (+) Transcript_32021:1358-1810(+)
MPRAELGPTFARLERAALETGGSHPGGGGGLAVVDYAVSQPTLEQAFLRFARAGPSQHRPPEPDDQEDLGTGAVTRCCGLDRSSHYFLAVAAGLVAFAAYQAVLRAGAGLAFLPFLIALGASVIGCAGCCCCIPFDPDKRAATSQEQGPV